MGNFIKIDRKILKWEWWSDINTYRLFTYMLIVAYWKNGKYKGKDIPRGSFPSSLSELSKETNLTENEVRTAIKHLKSTGEITSKPHNKFTIFTIKNYELYQSDNKQNNNKITSEITNDSQEDNKQITFKPHSIDELLTKSLSKEDKEYKNIENEEEREKCQKGEEVIITSAESINHSDIKSVLEAWNELERYGIRAVKKLKSTTNRYTMLSARISEYGTEDVLTAIENIKQSSFLKGKNNKGWTITFDWFVRPNNFPKVLEGNYTDNNTQNKETGFTVGSRDEQFQRLMERIRRDEENANRGC